MLVATMAPAAFAAESQNLDQCKEFYLLAAHGINGERLGLDQELPVDVYVNGGYAFTFQFKDKVKAKLPVGEYTITVNLARTDTQVIQLLDLLILMAVSKFGLLPNFLMVPPPYSLKFANYQL